MAVPKLYFTPVSAPRSKFVHAVCLTSPTRTACGVRCNGWRIALKRLNCEECAFAVHHGKHGNVPRERRQRR